MASSQLAIIQLALLIVGDELILSLADDSEARLAGQQGYESAIKNALARGPWNFANKKVQLSQLATVPLNEWQYYYQLPTDCCRVSRVWPDSLYDIYGDKIASNQTELAIDYNGRNAGGPPETPEGLEAIMPPHFERYAAHELLTLIGSAITNSDEKVAKFEQWRESAFNVASTIDAQQRPNKQFRHAPFVDARRRSGRL